jgi:hypothetical protein
MTGPRLSVIFLIYKGEASVGRVRQLGQILGGTSSGGPIPATRPRCVGSQPAKSPMDAKFPQLCV